MSNEHLVIDAGIGWRIFTLHPDEMLLTQQLSAQRRAGVRLVAPTLWRYEVTSILTKALHFKQLSLAEVERAVQLCGDFEIDLIPPDTQLATAALAWTIRLQRAASYDSFYLAVAQRLGCELWTVDQKLVRATGASWVRYAGATEGETP
ncbi:MAG: type II toxin-antitoxin system VapC family toxin [Caldilinea sp.]